MMPIPVPVPPSVAHLERQCAAQQQLLLAMLSYLQQLPQAPPLPPELSKICAAVEPARLDALIRQIDEHVRANKSTASRLLHDCGYSWDEAHAMVPMWTAWRPEHKRSALQQGLLRATLDTL